MVNPSPLRGSPLIRLHPGLAPRAQFKVAAKAASSLIEFVGHNSAHSRTSIIARPPCLFLLGRNFRFDVHVAELARFEDLAAVETLDVFRVFVTGDHLYTRMKALLVHGFAL